MKKEDLKAGMLVELRDGRLCFIMSNKQGLQVVDVAKYQNENYGWVCSVDNLSEEFVPLCNEFAIEKIYDLSPYSPLALADKRQLLWERTPKIKLTNEEIEILKALKVLGYTTIYREKPDGKTSQESYIVAFKMKSEKCSHWVVLDTNAFKFIKKENEDSFEIDELLKGEK